MLEIHLNVCYNPIMKRPLVYYNNPVLRKRCKDVGKVTDEVLKLVEDLKDTLAATETGIGLSAPQINSSLRVFITHVPLENEEGSNNTGVLRVFIDPKIISYSEKLTVRDEGCLSIPGLYAPVIRPSSVLLETTTLEGKRETQEYHGFEARCILHENDHINGVLFIDRLTRNDRKDVENQLRKIKRKYSPPK